MTTTKRLLSRSGAAVAVIATTLALAAPMTFGASPASATQITFCSAIRREHPVRPLGRLYSTWHPFVTRYLSFFQKLASDAPPLMGPHALNGLVSILENFTTAANTVQIKADILARPRWWSIGWDQYYIDIRYCATHPSV